MLLQVKVGLKDSLEITCYFGFLFKCLLVYLKECKPMISKNI